MSAATFDSGEDRRRGLRVALGVSVVAHAAVVAWFGFGPTFQRDPILGTQVVTVDLIAAAPAQAPAPTPVPRARPKPPPPAPSPRKVVLPTRAQRAAVPAPVVKPVAKPKPEEKSYEDLLEELRANRGETRPERFETPPPPPTPTYEPAPVPTPAPTTVAQATVTPQAGGAGRIAPPEVVAWVRDARIHVRREWVLAAGFRMQSLETHVEVDLDAGGRIRGEPRVTQRSGNPWYDESVVRAIQKADPLPAPPEAGKWPFVFRPEDY